MSPAYSGSREAGCLPFQSIVGLLVGYLGKCVLESTIFLCEYGKRTCFAFLFGL